MSDPAVAPPVAPIEAEARPSMLGRAVGGAVRRRVGLNASLIAGMVIVGAMVLAALLAGVLAPADPLQQDLTDSFAPPGTAGHPLGTDQLGRDVLSRLLYGGRVDLLVAFVAVLCPFLVGTTIGTVAAYRGGWLDSLLVGVIDVIIAFPALVLLIALVFVLGPGIATIVVAITMINWVIYARLARTLVRRERVLEYVLAARVGGIPTWRILLRHLVPNIISQSIVYAMSDAVMIILFVTALGFLGLGVPPPTADWGTMIAEGQPYFQSAWWLAVFPGVAIFITGFGLSLLADGVAEKLDAR
jgi:peptide/nickel transport system permease protein